MTLSPIAFWNDRTVPLNELSIPAQDRGFFFGDAVYEVISIYHSRPFLFDEHLERLKRSLHAIKIESSYDFPARILENIALNQIKHGMIYLQVSRGVAARAHSFHNLSLTPNVLIYAKSAQGLTTEEEFASGITAITHEDFRWGRCDIKSTNLLANCMMQSHAQELGAKEAILVRKEFGVTEGTSSNIFMVKKGCYITPKISPFILSGTVRNHLIKLLQKNNFDIQERSIESHELFSADELFITSTTRESLGIVMLDNKMIGDGKIGPFTKKARQMIQDSILERCEV